jgi:deazaflavin-dependent oxidoreductase (nitroreductase family)
MDKAALDEQNRRVIEEFRDRGGRVGGDYEEIPLLLLRHFGASTGRVRVNPMAYLAVDGGYAVFATNGGAAHNPAWFHNLRAHPRVTIDVGTESLAVVARVLGGEERERVWAKQKAAVAVFAELERATPREIPVVLFEPAPD